MMLCLLPVTALAANPGTKEVTIKLAYSDYGYEPTGSKGFTYTYIDNGNPVDDKITVTLPAAVGNETETSNTV